MSKRPHTSAEPTATGPTVAVVVPFFRCALTADEERSLAHLEAHLGRYERFFLAPEHLRPERPGFGVVTFSDRYFKSPATYSRLLVSPDFYQAFVRYDFILIYQLDCLVFRDELVDWCRAGYDYVGAPWLVEPETPAKGFSRAGNGGLSLRRVKGCLRVLGSSRVPGWRDVLRAPLPDLARRFSPSALRRRLRVLREARRGAAWYAAHYSLNEDHFWSDRAHLFWPGFEVAPVEVALSFAFERAPRYCFERGGGRLPFGCHAWARWDRAFWEPYLIP